MDFYQILSKETKDGTMELHPNFLVGHSKDLMIQGRTFYAIWDEEQGLWSRNEYDVQRLVDEDLQREANERTQKYGVEHRSKSMYSFDSNSWIQFRRYVAHSPDNYHPLDAKLVFANSEINKEDYASRRLPYAITEGDISAWEDLVTTLYSPDERAKIEWTIGSIVAGDSKKIQKFLVFYGPPASGKSTILNIIDKMFQGYTTTFDGKALGSSNSAFATASFKDNPLVAIQHDGNLSQLEDNARLNSIIAHEQMEMNEKYKPSYSSRVDAILLIGTNQPVKISDAKSGIIRRLIDVHPSGIKIPTQHYMTLLSQIEMNFGALAHHCLSVYLEMGKNYYNGYRPFEMMLQTDIFFNFIEAYYDLFKSQNGTTLKQAYGLYKEFCDESGIRRPLPQYKMREELRNYFDEFKDRARVDGEQVRSLYSGFNADKFKAPVNDGPFFSLVLEETESLLDRRLRNQPAQLAKGNETPKKRWGSVSTTLADINTQELHFVKVPDDLIVIDFDLKGTDGTKSLERNLEAASQWPATYAELSKSTSGVHLHYLYSGEVKDLASEYAEGIEVKTYSGDAALRRKLSRCNRVPIATISSGLPLKKKEKMLKTKTITSEKGLRDLIQRNLRKEIHPGTKPSVDFIHKILEDAHKSGMKYDVTDLRNKIIAFANNSTNQAGVALKVVQDMRFSSENGDSDAEVEIDDDRIAFFDVEIYPNLFVVCWKFLGDDNVVKLVNPKPYMVEALFRLKLVGFYNRRYDNHILYAASMGASNEELFKLSTKLIEGSRTAPFGAAYNISYADIWDFSSEKKSLKKFEIDLGILHMELDLPWDQPVDEKDWERVVEYCANDVRATEAVFENRKGDFVARQILAELSGLSVNDTTQRHTAKIIFGDEKNPQKDFVYTNLASQEFFEYKFELGKSTYRGENPGEGGYVYAEPGMYENVVVLDIVSMHPATIEILNLFGPYTKKYSELREARVAIKRQEYDKARKMLDGKLAPFLEGAEDDEVGRHGTDLAYALRIALNIVYGLTSAKFDNPFRDNRNIDNIVAKRGALFMIDLKHYLQNEGVQVVHIKTDSVKLPNADGKTVKMVQEFARQYGYVFEQEALYDRFCLVNDAVYVAGIHPVPWEAPYPKWEWTAVGAQFQHPYVFKTLFSEEPIEFLDYCEGRSVVKGAMYLDRTGEDVQDHTKMRHIGKTGLFVPVNDGGGILWRMNEGKYYAVSGTKGHLWMEADVAASLGDKLQVDLGYFDKLKTEAIKTIEQFGSFEEFTRKGR